MCVFKLNSILAILLINYVSSCELAYYVIKKSSLAVWKVFLVPSLMKKARDFLVCGMTSRGLLVSSKVGNHNFRVYGLFEYKNIDACLLFNFFSSKDWVSFNDVEEITSLQKGTSAGTHPCTIKASFENIDLSLISLFRNVLSLERFCNVVAPVSWFINCYRM